MRPHTCLGPACIHPDPPTELLHIHISFCSKCAILYVTDVRKMLKIFEPRHEISSNVVCATSKASDQPAHTRSLIRAFASRLNILGV